MVNVVRKTVKQKIMDILSLLMYWWAVIVSAAVIIGVSVYLLLRVESETINSWEIRFYIFIGFIVLLIMTFGVLRIYNATVVNSSYLLRNKRSMDLLSTNIESSTRDHGNSNDKLRSTNKDLYNALKSLGETIRNFKGPEPPTTG